MLELFKDRETEYLQWVSENRFAYVANVDKAHTSKQYPLAHLTTCGALMGKDNYTGGVYYKAGASTLQELEAWSQRATGRSIQYCERCRPRMGRHYWWVNHNKSHEDEYAAGYVWSPTEGSKGAKNETYLNLTRTRPGDVIVSYAGSEIRAIGIISGQCEDASIPKTHWQASEYWNKDGWKVPVEWVRLPQPIRPTDFLSDISPLLPNKHSPIRKETGGGNQNCYLARISSELGSLILDLVGSQVDLSEMVIPTSPDAIQNAQEQRKIEQSELPSTIKELLIKARVGQGLFRRRVLQWSSHCHLTGVTDPDFLIASHIKPWKDSDNQERLDGHNGLMLAPHVDRLFDRGWISFRDGGELLVASGAADVLKAWGIDLNTNVGPFPKKCHTYLEHHRKLTFKG
ncbi:HNH endonuclease [Pseudomonas sp. A-B-26]|uniref:HNH endonuclease n=1 Tax=Pseudomonas sp. A-B-26 TaxID=2832406 RepID=UPI001CBBD36E|nr:HNH endonuclease [Pseudomonas sp. A-B-26]